jgi:ABC-2 type transport system permease protein
MAIYKRNYRAYAGPLTPAWSRSWILTRYAWRYLFRSRFMTIFFIVCFFPVLFMALGMYLNHSESLLRLVRVPAGQPLISDFPTYFRRFLQFQSGLAMILTAFAGPTLISPDLANTALPLYFCRPFSRAEYVFGKFCVIAWLVSLVTWVPGLILFGIETGLSGATWGWNNLWLANAIFVGSLGYVLVLSFLGLALSAWVKWKPIAGALVLGTFFLGAGFGAAINAIMRSTTGYFIDIGHMMNTIWASLFRVADYDAGVSLTSAAVQLLVVCGLCLWMLARKTRAFEVVR